MGKMLDALLGRSFTTKKLESLLDLARRQLNYYLDVFQKEISQATSDVTELLKLGHHNNAYNKVDRVIKKQNYLDVHTLVIGYLHLLIDGVHLFEPNKDIHEELLEAVSSFLFAAPRIRLPPCMTAIQDVRNVLLSRFGQNLAAQYLEMRDNCGINPQIIDKLSKEPSLREVRIKFLEELAAKENIVLKLEEASTSTEGTSDVFKPKLASGLSDPVKRGKKKQCVVDGAEKAVENSSKGPEKKESEQESNDDELSDVRSESTRSISHSVGTIKLDEHTKELLEKDVDINLTDEETGVHVDHMVHSFEDTTGFTVRFQSGPDELVNSEN